MKRLAVIALTMIAPLVMAGPPWSLEWATTETGFTPYRSDDLQVYWNFNSGDGSYQANLGQLGSDGDAVQTNASKQCAVSGGFATFETTDALLTDGSSVMHNETHVTVSVWVRVHTNGGTPNDWYLWQSYDTTKQIYLAWNYGWGPPRPRFKGFYLNYNVLDGVSRNLNEWYNIAMTFDGTVGGGTAKLWLNGTNIATTASLYTSTWRAVQPWNFGNEDYDGDYDEVRIYDVTMTSNDLAQVYAEGRPE